MKKYDHYLALDWAQSNMAVAHAVKDSDQVETIDVVSDIKALKSYLKQFRGTKILTFEETSPAHWLYTELVDVVDEIIVCEPYANHMMKTGPKTDRVDAIKLLKLLRNNMLKPVFHCTDEFVNVRKIVSAYDDLITSIVQLKNRRSAVFRARGKRVGGELDLREDRFVVENLEALILSHEELRLKYEKEFRNIHRKNKMVKNLGTLPGIGLINSVKIAAAVIDPKRFSHKTGFWLYCGLQKYELISGGRSYGKRSPRFSRKLKCVFKTAALITTRMEKGPLKNYYQDLIKNRNYPEHQARHAVARRIAALALGVMKSNKEFEFKEQAC
jgi:transposase